MNSNANILWLLLLSGATLKPEGYFQSLRDISNVLYMKQLLFLLVSFPSLCPVKRSLVGPNMQMDVCTYLCSSSCGATFSFLNILKPAAPWTYRRSSVQY